MSTTVQRPQPSPAQPARAQLATNPYVGILAVFLGAGLATLNSRLLSVGLPDLRGSLGLGFDEASWLPTALNMAMMFSGVFVVFLNAFWGPRRILLPAAAIFMLTSLLLPFDRVGQWGCFLSQNVTSPAPRGFSGKALEDGREVRLSLETQGNCDLGKRHGCIR